VTDERTGRGKWSQPSVPHKGWTCVGVEDLEEPSERCGMCESVEIRYVHVMEHPNYQGTLGVGCICAEHMEQDYVGPRLREKRLQSTARRRLTWAKRTWNRPVRGNLYLNVEGFNLTIFQNSDVAGHHWGLKITHRASGRAQYGRRRYQSEDAAKHAALDAVIWAKEHFPR
jgi:hypothetical protein